MLKMQQGNVAIEMQYDGSLSKNDVSATVLPASKEQRINLGQAAIGQAWMAWEYVDKFPKVIKFMPPLGVTDDAYKRALNSYRFALRAADRHEMKSLAIPLPGQAGIAGGGERLEIGLCEVVLQECNSLRTLNRLVLVAKDDQEATCFANRLLNVQGWE